VPASRVEIEKHLNDVGNIFTSVTELSSDTDIRAIAFLWKREDVYKIVFTRVFIHLNINELDIVF